MQYFASVVLRECCFRCVFYNCMNPKEKINQLKQIIWDTKILAVTKYQTDERVLEAVKSWINLIGESRVQDAMRKHSLLTEAQLEFQMHMIGHLQTNKVKDALQTFDVIQSVDSEKLLRKIDAEVSQAWWKPQEIYLQINLTWESQKYGFHQDELPKILDLCQSLPWVLCTWYMCMWAMGNEQENRKIYQICKHLCTQHSLANCSMGMSWDREIALQEWSTMVRLGSALFN